MSLLRKLEVRVAEAIQKRKWGVLTLPMSGFYATAVHIRHWFYDHGWLASQHAPLPVVSIGNLVAGGVGKTQVALLLAQALPNVAILSRGFRGKAEKGKQPLVVSTKRHTAQECGDEPWLLASRLPRAQVIVHRDRYKSALEAKKLGAKVLVLDDGMQHRQLFRDFEIVVLSGRDPFGGEHFLPRGFLREDPKRLARADFVIFVGKPSAQVEKKVARLTSAPCIETRISVTELRLIDDQCIPSLEGKKIGLFCGIGNPERFVASMEALGAHVVATHYLPDHRTFEKKEWFTFATLCKERGAEYLFCTEKDHVKLPSFTVLSPLPVGWARVELTIIKNREAWDRMTNEITLLAGITR